MSLTSFLLGSKPSGKKKAIDTELDALFCSQTTLKDPPEPAANDGPVAEIKKKKRSSNVHTDAPDSKRFKPSPTDASSSSSTAKQKKSGNSRVQIAPEPVLGRAISDATKVESSKSVSSHVSSSESSDDDGDAPTALIHETVQKSKPSKPTASRKAKYAPEDETKGQRDARTIFIGNLVPDVAAKRPLQKQLRRHILAFIPTAKIESTRFRSVAFQTPTSKIPETADEAKSNKQPRQHDQDRASSWRDAHAADGPKTDEKKFLTPSQKKKIAFINKAIHSDADSVHAYIVFAYPPPLHSRPANLPPPPPAMDPFEAARLAIERCNGSMFLDRMLRVDGAVKRSTTEKSVSDSTALSSAIGDPKLTVFVGNLDFASKEDDLRVFFEGILSAERGPPDVGGSEEVDKPKRWVTRVRMIRDKDTLLGKGFAYVQFSDRTCVDEVLALEQGKLKFAKRKLRVQRCKSLQNASSVKNTPSKRVQTSDSVPVPPVPKGDPSLGEKLVKLSKEERKRVKAADADRVARRMAKKKARMALGKQGVALQSKQRERARKPSVAKNPNAAPSKKASRGRIRSEKSAAKKNTKK